jgi:molecular chaperone DnaK
MREEAKAHESDDKERREKIDKLNAADSLIFQTEKQLKEFGDKLPEDKKKPIEDAVAKLKEAHKAQDLAAIDTATKELNDVWQKASEEMYKAGAAQGQPDPSQAEPQAEQQQQQGKNDDEVTDVDFEEVK